MKRAVLKSAVLGGLMLCGLTAISQPVLAEGARTYNVVIRNATADQPVAPSLFVTHDSGFSMFEVGTAPDPMTDAKYFGLAKMAETGNPSNLVFAITDAEGVSDIVVLPVEGRTPPVLLPGESNDTEITASGNAKYFSAVAMLGATHDAFYAVRGVELPKQGSITVYGIAYDAGSEANSEVFADTAAGGNADEVGDDNIAVNGEGYIYVHPGIHGIADQDTAYDWRNPVVEITITRIHDEEE